MDFEERATRTRWSALLDDSLFAAPPHIAGALALAQYARVHAQLPWLHFSIAVMAIAGFLTDNREPRSPVELVVSVLILGVVFLRWIAWQRAPKHCATPQEAQHRLKMASLLILLVVAPCALWIMTELQAEPDDQKDLVMLLVVLGSLATASCYAWYPPAAMIPLLLGCVPIALLMLQIPDFHTVALAMAVIMITVQQARLITGRYQELIEALLLQHEMEKLALTDPLTGLSNRRALNEALELAIARPDENRNLAVAMLDLDGFKPVNDRHGHAAGDDVLRQVAIRIKAAAGARATVARLGGDEFAILFSGADSTAARKACDALITSFAVPFRYEGHAIALGASLGLACYPEDGETLERLMGSADRALYAVKAEHRQSAKKTPVIIRQVAA